MKALFCPFVKQWRKIKKCATVSCHSFWRRRWSAMIEREMEREFQEVVQ